jgi:hypothetical protein
MLSSEKDWLEMRGLPPKRNDPWTIGDHHNLAKNLIPVSDAQTGFPAWIGERVGVNASARRASFDADRFAAQAPRTNRITP